LHRNGLSPSTPCRFLPAFPPCRFQLAIANLRMSCGGYIPGAFLARISAKIFTGSIKLHKRSKNTNSDPSEQIAEEQWLVARRIARELDRILDGTDTRGAAVDRAAAELRLGRRQVYNLLARYRPTRRISSLLPSRTRTRKKRL